MLMKKHYDLDQLAAWQEKHGPRARYMQLREKPAVSYVEVKSASREWHVPPSLVEQGAAEGWLTLGDGRITLKTAGSLDNVVYRIVRVPGHYCCHCGEKIEDDGRGTQAREHLAREHTDVRSPDPQNPSGWRRDAFYACELESGAVAKSTGRERVTRGWFRNLLGA